MTLKKQQNPLHTHQLTLFDSMYDLTTNDRRAVMGKNTQLDEGTGRKTWKCLDPLHCVASAAFRKHSTWLQTWTWHYQDKCMSQQSLDIGHRRDRLMQ